MRVLPNIEKTIQVFLKKEIANSRKEILEILIKYIIGKIENNKQVNLNFICTHNSRRSQFCQIWSSTASQYYNIPVNCYSGGTEITECNKRVIKSIINNGFLVTGNDKNKNPEYLVAISANKTIKLFSKLFKKSINNDRTFIAVMTCSDADKNCPYIPGAEKRISLKYDDPKKFDNTTLEIKKYEECSYKIASEIFYVFSEVSKKIKFH